MKRKVISAVLAATMAVTMMMGCGSTGTSADGNGSTSKSEESGNDGGKVTLKVFSNHPDRKTCWRCHCSPEQPVRDRPPGGRGQP